ncbi:PD40 domain-containing protein [Kribbella sp. VKM Ac-2566]|jgi:Tol biopolymer transport system component|uniref:PD40 domain-containing protein n=1 Tax=Kribbella sp. VKM Ac-2566 TaxID=2512218 RepID=UPI0010628DBD|nr:PD40 domain-containing protein [Kribbella sp. VKM Ac-2566]TDX03111.1 WD40 repeat protein [Kribbella sp. VKM Ac-2566]
MPRTLRPGQRSELYVVDVATNTHRLVFSSDEVLFEAPNWLPDGTLVVNGNGLLFRVTDALEEIELGGVPAINNDHVVSPDGRTVYVSANDGHIYAVPIDGGPGRRVTNDRGPGFHHYLHGVSPDGTTLAYIGLEWVGDRRITNVWTIPAAGGADVPVTDDMFADDGSEFSPDGRWIYFNSERDGHAQLFRVLVEGSAIEKLTFDERVNWFPHPAPDWSAVAYVSFPPGTEGHPADIDDVRLRLLTNDGEIRELTSLFGGQGTMNVPSWSPDSASFAYVTYPL